MGLYITNDDVKARVRGKIRFKINPDEDDGAMAESLLTHLIAEAESDVEFDMSQRYAVPFQTHECQPFSELPERPTKQYIRTLCTLKSVLRVLETDFGSGAIDADDYVKRIQKRYDDMLGRNMSRRGGDEDQNQYLHPPLSGLKISYHNELADDGYRGMVMNTSDKRAYAPDQINSPRDTWFNIDYEDIFGDDY